MVAGGCFRLFVTFPLLFPVFLFSPTQDFCLGLLPLS
jgi:hypothetical protein